MMQTPLAEPDVTPDISVTSLKDFCSWALEKWKDKPEDETLRGKALCAAREAAEVIAGLATARSKASDRDLGLELAKIYRESGIHDGETVASDVARAESLRSQGWAGIIASMILAPSWSFSRPLSYDAVPRWMWVEFTRYRFSSPGNARARDLANSYAADLKKNLAMLAQLSRANRGSSAVRAVMSAYSEQSLPGILGAASIPVSDCISLRAGLANFDSNAAPGSEPLALDRAERALRLGVCLQSISDTSAARFILALVKHLPAARFDVQYFVSEYTYGKLEGSLRSESANITILDTVSPGQCVEMACLDAALLLVDPLEAQTPISQLGHRRFAPLQIATNLSGTPTYLPEIDLFLGVERTTPPPRAERLGVLPLAGMVCYVDEAADSAPAPFTRASLGIAQSAKVLVSLMPHRMVSFEMIGAWSEILQREPDSHLLLHLVSDCAWDDEAIQGSCRDIASKLASKGFSPDRLTLLGERQSSFEDWVGLMRLSDVHLDSFPCSTPIAVAASLSAAIPTVCRTGGEPRMRSGALMLQAQKLSEYVATDAAQFVELTCRLLASEKERGQVKSLLLNSLGEGMPGRDSLGASDAFGALLASAYDEAYRTGLQPFKSEAGAYSVAWNSKPAALMAEAEEALATGFPNNAVALMETALGLDPLGLDARRLMGRALAQGGQHRRAADYLQSVALRSPKDPQAWYELSRSFFCNSSLPAACSALKKSIALDSRRPDAWFLLGEMTLAAGDVPGARDVVNVIRGLAPADLRLGALEGRIAACFGAPLPGATGQSECGGQDFSGCQLAAQESHSEDGLLTH